MAMLEPVKRGDIYDIIVIGGGPAGMTAGLFAARAGMWVALFERFTPGGQLADAETIENYPGFPEGIGGFELAQTMHQQLDRFGAEVIEEEVLSVDLKAEPKIITTAFGTYKARSVIVATGSSPKKLGVPLEKELTGRGVSYCATCDGGFFRDMVTVVAGGGNTAAADAIYLARVCKKVYVVHRRDTLRATAVYHKIIEDIENIEFVWNSEIVELLAKDETLGGVMVNDLKSGETQIIPCQGLFVAIGTEANTHFLHGQLELSETGHIVADESGRTLIPGVYVAGDVRTKPLRQVATAVADGANAAEDAAEFIAAQKR